MTRPIREIAREIVKIWYCPNFAARPYLGAMLELDGPNDYYLHDSAKSVVLYFLSNARTWRGPDARRLKAELKEIIGA
jgi:hypothetical protein